MIIGAKNKPRNGKRRSGRGALIGIGVLLAGSGLVRLTQSAEHANFTMATNQIEGVPLEDGCAPQVDKSKLLVALLERETALNERQEKIEVREQTMAMAETAIRAKMEELVQAEAELAKTMSIADRAADEDVARLVALYENMKPKQAAPLFEEMAPEFAAGFLARMRPDAAALILSGLDPTKAYSISVLMAGRNANAPKN
jgi:flagellar motility protein MotE (MotC chaperone)